MVSLGWERPFIDGGSQLLNYSIYRREGVGNMELIDILSPNATYYDDVNVTPGLRYEYVISSSNLKGEGACCSPLKTTAAILPSPPRNLTSRFGDGFIFLSWDGPEDSGGIDVQNYLLKRSLDGENWIKLANQDNSTFSFNDTDVSNGIEYQYRVFCFNEIGGSSGSHLVSDIPARVPGPPLISIKDTGLDYICINWSAHDTDLFYPITGYLIFRQDGMEDSRMISEVGPESVSFNDTEVILGTVYTYYVICENELGRSVISNLIEIEHLDPRTEPGPPVDLTYFSGEDYVLLYWKAPANDGRSSITNYSLYKGEALGNEILFASVSPYLMSFNDTDVSRGKTYFYYLVTNNVIGPSDRTSTLEVKVPHESSESDDCDDGKEEENGPLFIIGLIIGSLVVLIAIAIVIGIVVFRKRQVDGATQEDLDEVSDLIRQPITEDIGL
jgi:titin